MVKLDPLKVPEVIASQFSRRRPEIFDELLSETNLALAKAIARYDPSLGASLSTYAWYACRGAALWALKRERRRRLRPRHVELTEVHGLDPRQPDPAASAAVRDLAQAAARAVEALGPRERAAVELLAQGLTGPEIGERLGCSKQRVHQILSKARGRVRAALGEDD